MPRSRNKKGFDPAQFKAKSRPATNTAIDALAEQAESDGGGHSNVTQIRPAGAASVETPEVPPPPATPTAHEPPGVVSKAEKPAVQPARTQQDDATGQQPSEVAPDADAQQRTAAKRGSDDELAQVPRRRRRRGRGRHHDPYIRASDGVRTIATSIHFPVRTHDKLRSLAFKNREKQSAIVTRAVEEYLDRLK